MGVKKSRGGLVAPGFLWYLLFGYELGDFDDYLGGFLH